MKNRHRIQIDSSIICQLKKNLCNQKAHPEAQKRVFVNFIAKQQKKHFDVKIILLRLVPLINRTTTILNVIPYS